MLTVSPTSTLSPSRPHSPSRVSPVILNIRYPLLPSMDPHELPYFHKGAQIALDNILDDYLENPEMSLFEVIADLEDKRPVVGVVKEDWERRCVVEGARWVGDAVGKWWGDWFVEEGEDKDDGGESKKDDEDEVMVDGVGGNEGHSFNRVEHQSGTGREKTDRGLRNDGLKDSDDAQRGFGEAANGDMEATMVGEKNAMVAFERPGVEHYVLPLDEVGSIRNLGDDNVGGVAAEDEDVSGEEKRSQDDKEARVVICMLRLLGRWIELQIEHASKTA
jgi:hypothetical protein